MAKRWHDEFRWYHWLFAVAICVFAVATLLNLLIDWKPVGAFLWQEKAAGWAQAIGGGLAIIGAFLVAHFQHLATLRRDAEHDRARRRDQLFYTWAIVIRTGAVLNSVRGGVGKSDFFWQGGMISLQESYAALIRLPAQTMPPELAIPVAMLTEAVLRLQVIGKAAGPHLGLLEVFDLAIAALDDVKTVCRDLIKEVCTEEERATMNRHLKKMSNVLEAIAKHEEHRRPPDEV